MTRTLVVLLILGAASRASGAELPDDQLARGQSMMARGDYRGAIDALTPLAQAPSLTPMQRARLHLLLSASWSQTGPDDTALAEADLAEREARPIDAAGILSRVESVRGVVWFNRGRSTESLAHFQACLSWAQKSRESALVAGAYVRLAAAYQDLGDWTRALDAVTRADESDPHPSDAARVQSLTRRGLIEIELHEGDAARRAVAEALAIVRRIGDRRTECQVLIDMSLVDERVDHDFERAAEDARQAVEIAHTLAIANLEIPARNALGSVLRLRGDLRGAEAELVAALRLIEQSGDHRDEPYVLKNLGQVQLRSGRAADGERTLRRAAAAADAVGLTRVRWLARLELAELYAAADPAAARREFDETLTIVEEQQTNVLLEGFRAGALDQTLAEYDPYDRAIQFLLGRGDTAAAFATAERARARAFLDVLSGQRELIAADAPAGYADQENAILRRISQTQAALRAENMPAARRGELVNAVDRDEAELTSVRLRLAVERPALANERYPKPWPIDAVQRTLLARDEALLTFYLGAGRSVAWLVTPDRVDTIALPPRAEIERRTNAALRLLRDPVAGDAAALADLARTLRLDRLTLPAGTRLIVIPHGILCDLPLEALPDARGGYLLERLTISYAPSAASLAYLRSVRRADGATPILAVGNPIVSAAGRSAARQVDLQHVNLLAPMPYSGAELHEVASLFGRRARLLEGADATESSLRGSEIESARIVHFATHGLIDETRPERSGLVLTAHPPDEDGLLQMHEIYGLRLHADLVTLSACQTALGQLVSGEGVLGLTRAFFYAGARSVVASLWDVDDASTARLMADFYRNLERGEPIDRALQQAKLARIREGGATARPFFWAAFIVSGESRAVVTGDSRRTIAAAIAGAIVLMAGAWLFSRRRRA